MDIDQISDPDLGDIRNPDTIKIDVLTDLVTELAKDIGKILHQEPVSNHIQTIVHKTDGMNNWSIAAVISCFFTIVLILVFQNFNASIAKQHEDQLRDLQAWKDIYGNQLSELRAKDKK